MYLKRLEGVTLEREIEQIIAEETNTNSKP